VNVVTLIGNLATDIDLKEVAGDKKVASFLLAVQRPTKESEADFVWVSVWDRQAETCAQFLSKGQRVALDGRLKSRTWEQDGQRRDAIEVVANRVQFLSPPPAAGLAEVVPFERAAAG
jgi:single-strand DNA-binding protein